jgi:hypothetical protein
MHRERPPTTPAVHIDEHRIERSVSACAIAPARRTVRRDPRLRLGDHPRRATGVNVDQRHPDIPAGHRSFQPSRPWSAFSQPRYISKRSATTSTTKMRPRQAGRSPGWPTQAPSPARLGGWVVASHRPPEGYHAAPQGTSGKLGWRLGEMVPRGAAWSGYVDGMPRLPVCKRHQWLPGIGKASRHPARQSHGLARNSIAISADGGP